MADRRRRKSLNVFRPSLTALTPIHDESPRAATPSNTLKKKRLRTGSFRPGSSSTPASPLEPSETLHEDDHDSSPLVRPRALQKSQRPSSIFGSFRSSRSLPDDDENLLRLTSDRASIQEQEEPSTTLDVDDMIVHQHGEVQTSGHMFRKRIQYLVLTNSHLMRFKSRAKASEMFPVIPASVGRGAGPHHSRKASGGSMPESYLSVDPSSATALYNVVAVYKLDDGRPYFTLELAVYDEITNSTSTMSIQLNDPKESEQWLSSLRDAIYKARMSRTMPFGRKAVEYAARALEHESDYDPSHFRIFTVAQRASSKTGHRSSTASTDDLGKLQSSICYLVIGYHKLHLIPLPRPSKTSSSTSIPDMNGASHGILLLTAVHIQQSDDSFQLAFRAPLQPTVNLQLASSSVFDIGLCLRQAADYLRPAWIEPPFTWAVTKDLDDALLPVPPVEQEDHLAFDRTLTAYCVAYNLDPSRIRYTVHYEGEDAPEFELLEANDSKRAQYTALELLAIIRALRFNESFHAISFRYARLDALHGLYDRQGSEHFMWTTKSGQRINLPRLDQTPLIVQELQCLALKSSRLRRLDFTNCLSRKAKDLGTAQDPGSGVCEAIFPLCALQLTNVDWIILDGTALSDIDIEYLFAAAIKRSSHFRALGLGWCGLSDDTMTIAVQSIVHQESTMELLNLSGNPARLDAETLDRQLGRFKCLRRLDLSNFLLHSGSEPILSVETMLHWRLEYLNLSGTSLNAESVDSLAAYLVSKQSDTLRELRLEQCQMSGEDVATLLESLCEGRAEPRPLHILVSENRLEKHHDKLTETIARSITPTHLTMRMLEYSNEKNFQALIDALALNDALLFLDLSRISLPYDAGKETCKKLRNMLATNTSLQELNLSGEEAHLEAVTLGRNLPEALRGLAENTALRVLRIEHQVLGLPGATALAAALGQNLALRELHCDDNEISLQAFTILVNAVRDNMTLQYLSEMEGDRAASRSKIDREITNILSPRGAGAGGPGLGDGLALRAPPLAAGGSGGARPTSRSSMRRALSGAVTAGGRSLNLHRSASNTPAGAKHHAGGLAPPALRVTEQDVQAAVASLEDSWTAEKERLYGYLRRNYCLANDLPLESAADGGPTAADGAGGVGPSGAGGSGGGGAEGDGSPNRPPTAGSLATALRQATLDQTPTAELDRQLGGGAAPVTPVTPAEDGDDGLVMDAIRGPRG